MCVASQFLLDKGADVIRESEVPSLTPLMAASQCGHTDIAAKLIKAGSNVNAGLKVNCIYMYIHVHLCTQYVYYVELLTHSSRIMCIPENVCILEF